MSISPGPVITVMRYTTAWNCTRRFPLQQPTKMRLIDDGLESGLNPAYSCYNKLTLMDMDAVVALANIVLQVSSGFLYQPANF